MQHGHIHRVIQKHFNTAFSLLPRELQNVCILFFIFFYLNRFSGRRPIALLFGTDDACAQANLRSCTLHFVMLETFKTTQPNRRHVEGKTRNTGTVMNVCDMTHQLSLTLILMHCAVRDKSFEYLADFQLTVLTVCLFSFSFNTFGQTGGRCEPNSCKSVVFARVVLPVVCSHTLSTCVKN